MYDWNISENMYFTPKWNGEFSKLRIKIFIFIFLLFFFIFFFYPILKSGRVYCVGIFFKRNSVLLTQCGICPESATLC